MSEIYLVRHGQASFGAKNYDKLSELGHQQARWLGEYFSARGITFSQAFMGDMVRHRETTEGILDGLIHSPVVTVDTGFNEFNFQNIGNSYLSLNPQNRLPENPKPADFYRLLKLAMHAWSEDLLPKSTLDESWLDFKNRVQRALDLACLQNSDKPILIVSSGGAISMLMSLVLGLDAKQIIELNMQVRNTSISHFFFNKSNIRLSSFNNIPHLDHPDRLDSITFS
ncbi:histidine phosphatase family protein [Paraglaciecola psychrophila]|uniref:Phosphoglycerate mutase n=1 Tax=Paraglaciecola psychrophila 170 TaxID=1129794 RepID=K6ZP34_9ALTE|nr:histidine phosphatase family protein [Paraglaciecola psychrophila]AGH46035.1 phosphoglycerate mutase [Paraglaciecola psychrophila 170]GAC37711.1 phosphoglycerate mutase family protein, putative [Paraglaciecola psychrophila 170]